jgi:hypothetical protein
LTAKQRLRYYRIFGGICDEEGQPTLKSSENPRTKDVSHAIAEDSCYQRASVFSTDASIQDVGRRQLETYFDDIRIACASILKREDNNFKEITSGFGLGRAVALSLLPVYGSGGVGDWFNV